MADILDYSSDIEPFFGSCCSSEMSFLDWLRRGIESQARQYVGHVIAQETITGELQRRFPVGNCGEGGLYEMCGDRICYEDRPQDDAQILQLDNAFVRSITDLRQDYSAMFGQGGSDFPDSSKLTAGTDYVLELDAAGLSKSGRVINRCGAWSSRPGTIKITYVAGLTASELSNEYAFVKLALLEDMQLQFNRVKAQRSSSGNPIRRESWSGDYSVEYAVQDGTQAMWQLSPAARAKLAPIKRMLL